MKDGGRKGLFDRALQNIDHKWEILRIFAYRCRSIFELGFLFLYTLEQAALIYIVARGHLTSEIVSYFALIVIATFALNKMVMESRIKLLEEDVNDLSVEKDLIKKEYDTISKKNKELFELYTKIKNKR